MEYIKSDCYPLNFIYLGFWVSLSVNPLCHYAVRQVDMGLGVPLNSNDRPE